MAPTAEELRKIVSQYTPLLRSIQEDEISVKPSPVKWSKKEILGHLVDSAQNNIRRFIVAQYEDEPHIVYDQDKWVSICNYQNYDLSELIGLWSLLNKQICHILENTNAEMTQRKSQTQELHTVEWLAKDYIKHLLHHLHQVLNLEPVAYP